MSTDTNSRMQNARAYLRGETGQAGSDLYYSTLHLEPADRDAVLCVFALQRAFERITTESSDPTVAQAKLAWWSEELRRSAGGTPTHPLTLLLSGSRERYRLDADDFAALALHAVGRLRPSPIDDFDDLLARHRAVATPFVRLLTPVATSTALQQPALIALVTALHVTESLLTISRRARRGYFDLPLSDFSGTGLDPTDVLAPEPSPALPRLLGRHCDRVCSTLRRTLDEFGAEATPTGLVFHIQGEIALATLDRVRRDPLSVMRGRPELTPLRKLWIAWRTRRRVARSIRLAAKPKR